jgi:hypothetical protein
VDPKKALENNTKFMHDIAAVWWRLLQIAGEGDFWKGATLLHGKRDEGKLAAQTCTEHAEELKAFALKHATGDETKNILHDMPDMTRLLTTVMSSGMGNAMAVRVYAACIEAGLPVVEVGHKLTASLVLSKVSAEVLADASLPFPAFTIKVPDELIGKVKTISVGRHYATPEGQEPMLGFAFVVHSSDATAIWHLQPSLPQLLGSDEIQENEGNERGVLDTDVREEDQRVLVLVKRLIIGVCLYMEGGDRETRPIRHVGKAHDQRRVPGTLPTENRIYRLTADVKHSFVQDVKDYVVGTGKRLNVQFMVVGHWRNQTYGPKNSLRRRQFIEPFWKGPETAPIAVRAHKLEEA